jgi:hypothetical protein
LESMMDEVRAFLEAVKAARMDPSPENILSIVEKLSPFSPPGLEWGIELFSLAGVTYMLEDGRLLMVRVSRDEFGPFMQTSVAEIPVGSLPQQAIQHLSDIDGFLGRIRRHLSSWLMRSPENHPKRAPVATLLKALEE